MSEGAEQDRSELPTQHKLQRARREGTVARGTDLGFLSVLVGLTGLTWFAGERVVAALMRSTAVGIAATDAELVGAQGFMALTGRMAAPLMSLLLPMAGGLFALVLVLEFVQTGPVFSSKALRFDFNRLNPATGLKRLFTVRILIETAKGVLKLALYSAVAAVVIMAALKAAPAVTDAGRLATFMGASMLKLFAAGAGVAAAIALLDQLMARREFLKKMRMSRRDVKREHKDREGDPRLKQKRKALHGEFARTSQSLRGIRNADLVVVNPVHFAVALRYQPGIVDAPLVVSRGSHAMALRLRRLAFAYGVPVIVDPPLARRLFQRSVLSRPIPEELFRPVADLYLSLRRKPPAQGTPTDV
ncbi:EscU/YscU/HrcU family type III secretion system export apparatus switch protein [Brevundimonas sp.]|uniref:EscU/YscU/HrcU family type III secretion system export apparatus switch protein n=1 Tax=Brevundimonas sp. TaxID=1871086 RepID=UPI002D69E0EF|nr:EscU/YscU/HrcU family type III secretion system export apparatus switch protein [Brevundimonas sp.]HYC68882.1 EscU/YscU/HrcU family type III secretion system export apparatus switch protein [Brevundimonas sp.]